MSVLKDIVDDNCDMEMTPMIDVVFLLIIFFMTTARFARETRADLELPPEVGEQQETGEEAGLIINIDANGTIIVGAEELTIETLEELVLDRVSELRGREASRSPSPDSSEQIVFVRSWLPSR